MTEEQKQLTIGQIADMKAELENSVKRLLHEFVERTGVDNVSIDASLVVIPQLNSNGTVTYDKRECAQLRYSFNF